MNKKFSLLLPLCLIIITSGCESTPTYTQTSSLPPPIDINNRCPEGATAKIVSDMRNMTNIECVHDGVKMINERVPSVVKRGYGVAGIPIVR